MTEEQKEYLIAKMLDSPSSLSDEELDAILHDDELCDIYKISSYVSNASIPEPEFDMKAEWERFRHRPRRRPAAMRWIVRVAAIFLGVTVVAGAAVGLVDNIFTPDQQPAIAMADSICKSNDTTAIQHFLQPVPSIEISSVESTRRNVRQQVSNSHITKTNTTTDLRDSVGEEGEIDVDEYLRIQQARIDNEIVTQAADTYMAQYEAIVPILDAVGIYDPQLDKMISKITME